MSSVKTNIVANIAGRLWGFVSIFAFYPLYLKFLGSESFGLVGFYSMLVGMLVVADVGLTSSINREFARLSVSDKSSGNMKNVLRTYEITYFFISVFIVISFFFLAPIISAQWLNFSNLQLEAVTDAIRLMGFAVSIQLLSGLYIGGLMGLQRQVMANGIQIAWGVVRGGGSVAVLWLVSPTIYAFALWQLLVNIVYFVFTRYSLWRIVNNLDYALKAHFSVDVLRETGRYAAGLAGMAVISAVLLQADKIIVSKYLTLEMLGYYTLAGTLALVPITVTSTIAAAAFPRMTGLVSLGHAKKIKLFYRKIYELVAVTVIPIGVSLVFFSDDLIFIWTGSIEASKQAGLVSAFLIVGQLLQALTFVPYYLALANGNVKLNLKIGIISILLLLPLLFILVLQYDLIGAGLSWMIMNVVIFLPYMYYLHRSHLPGEYFRWLVHGLCIPMLISLPVVAVGRLFVPDSGSVFLKLFLIVIVWASATLLVIMFTPSMIRYRFINKP